MRFARFVLGFVFFALINALSAYGWTTEDLELFDLVESTSQNFYDFLGVDKKASAGDIRKAYRKLSTLYHPDKNKNADAEETFRKIAAIADVLRNDERRKTYDLVLQTGLPDWRMPIYYYRHVRNMGLLELTIFLFGLATFAQYLFAWSVYWEKKYEIEEIVLSRLKKKAKHQRKAKNLNLEEDLASSEEICNLPKPKCRDLFPVRLFYFFIHVLKSSPSYIATCKEFFKHREPEPIEEETEEPQEVRVKVRKQAKPQIPDYTSIINYSSPPEETIAQNGFHKDVQKKQKKWTFDALADSDILEFKKALKKFPNGTLQRWEKVADTLDCSVSEVVSMVKQLKNQQFSKHVPLAMQGVTGTEKENYGYELYEQKDLDPQLQFENGHLNTMETTLIFNPDESNGDARPTTNGTCVNNEKFWKQEEQRSLEVALQKFRKDATNRWDKIADFVATKSKEECVERYKILVQQIKKKKDKAV